MPTGIRAYIQAYMHTGRQAIIKATHTILRTYMYTYMQAGIHTYIHIHACSHTHIHPCIHTKGQGG